MSVQHIIEQKLQAEFQPQHLQVLNESHMHAVPPNSETHFKVVVVTQDFDNKRPVQRHQAVYALLADELAAGVHALALHTFSPEEWASSGEAPASPNCMGGEK
ncbi:BolA family protein [Porticoccus sp. GXU_MW_L64]